MNCDVIIVAAGRGSRLGATIPKQYLPLNGPCALSRSISAFLQIGRVRYVLPVIHRDDRRLFDEALSGVQDSRLLNAISGGETRAKTVLAGLEALARNEPDRVLIHDAARPFVPARVIENVISALDREEGACAALPLVDALWRANDGLADSPIDRTQVWRAQTPQGFEFKRLLAAHRAHDGNGADDVTVAREAGMRVAFVEGSEQSYKITTQADLKRALRDTD